VELLDAFLSWAWARHHKILSWYIRPLFLLPFCYFAYRRSIKGIVLTLLALASSMFWFLEPEQPDPEALDFLQRFAVRLNHTIICHTSLGAEIVSARSIHRRLSGSITV